MGLQIVLSLNHNFGPSKWGKLGTALSVLGVAPLEPPEVAMAILNCRRDGDYFHLVVLPLKRVGSRFIRHPKEHPTLLPIESLTSGYLEQMIIIRNDDATSRRLQRDRHLAFIFRNLAPEIKILEVHPFTFWDPKDKILQGLTYRHDQRPWHACLRLEFSTDTRRQLLLVLGMDIHVASKEEARERYPWASNGFVLQPWYNLLRMPQCKTLAQLHNEHQKLLSRLRDKDRYQNSEDRFVRVELNGAIRPLSKNFRIVLDEYMCIVDITLEMRNRGEKG